jgi:hypothetical protein
MGSNTFAADPDVQFRQGAPADMFSPIVVKTPSPVKSKAGSSKQSNSKGKTLLAHNDFCASIVSKPGLCIPR